jgi:hypothetical protein
VAEKHGEISERHLELLRVTADLARNDPTAVAQMYTAAQRMNLNTVGKQADRAEFIALVRALEGVGYVEVRGMGLAASYGMLCVTEEGHRQLAAPKSLPGTPAPAEEETERAEPRPASERPQEGAERPWWKRVFWGR